MKIQTLTNELCEDVATCVRNSFVETYRKLAPESHRLLVEYADKELSTESFSRLSPQEMELCFALVENGKVHGVMELKNQDPPEKQAKSCLRVLRLYLSPQITGKGFGKKFLKHAERIAEDQKRSAVWLSVWDLNIRAQEFYLSHGYKKSGLIPWDYETPYDARHDMDIIYLKHLS